MGKIKRVFVLGNGATLACQKEKEESFRNLLDWGYKKSKENIDFLSNIDNNLNFLQKYNYIHSYSLFVNNIKENYENLQQRFEYIQKECNKKQKFLYRMLDLFKAKTIIPFKDINDIVEYLYNIDYSKMDIFNSKISIMQGVLDDTFIDDLYNLQRNIVELFCLEHNDRNIYNEFSSLLVDDDIIINLNWDNLFEKAYRVEKNKEPYHILLKNTQNIQNKGNFLLKPHGSIEYFICLTDSISSYKGCFDITIQQDSVIHKYINNGKTTCNLCGRELKKYFIQPYTRCERAIYSQPFVQMAIETSKSIIKKDEDYEFTFIGYSFAEDKKGWIDYDLLPMFIRAKKINIVAYGQEDANNIKQRIENINLLKNKEINALSYKGFGEYIEESKKYGYLLDK